MQIELTTLSENTANFGFISEWGLSILAEVDNVRILVDTGLSHSAVHNAQLVGIDLSKIDRIVLSHGHVDHTGGLRDVLKIRGEVEVIAHPDIWSEKHVHRDQRKPQYCGIPFRRQELESLGARFNLTKEPFYINDNVMTSGEIPMISEYEQIEGNLLIKKDQQFQPDPLADDLALIINADFGLVIILGCAHRGIINTVCHAQKLTGRQKVHTVIGGTHLLRASDERLRKTIAELRGFGIQKLGVSHCTGFHAAARLAQEFEGIFFINNTGHHFSLPLTDEAIPTNNP